MSNLTDQAREFLDYPWFPWQLSEDATGGEITQTDEGEFGTSTVALFKRQEDAERCLEALRLVKTLTEQVEELERALAAAQGHGGAPRRGSGESAP